MTLLHLITPQWIIASEFIREQSHFIAILKVSVTAYVRFPMDSHKQLSWIILPNVFYSVNKIKRKKEQKEETHTLSRLLLATIRTAYVQTKYVQENIT